MRKRRQRARALPSIPERAGGRFSRRYSGAVTSDRVLVAIPALNERATVADVVAEVKAAAPAAEVLVVDDGSSDGTSAVAAGSGAEVVVLPFNVGVGGAMRTAFLYARSRNCDAVVQVDADGQHDVSAIPSLLAALDDADIVVGARFTDKGDYAVRGPRRWAMAVLSHTLSRVTGGRLSDTTSGFRAAGPRAIELFATNYPSEYLGDTVESLVIASRAGLTITEVPVSMRPRQGGAPSQGPIHSTLYLGRAALALAVALARRPRPAGSPE